MLLLRQTGCSLFKSPNGPCHLGYKHHPSAIHDKLCVSWTLTPLSGQPLGLLHPRFPWQQPGSFNTTPSLLLTHSPAWLEAGLRLASLDKGINREAEGQSAPSKRRAGQCGSFRKESWGGPAPMPRSSTAPATSPSQEPSCSEAFSPVLLLFGSGMPPVP